MQLLSNAMGMIVEADGMLLPRGSPAVRERIVWCPGFKIRRDVDADVICRRFIFESE